MTILEFNLYLGIFLIIILALINITKETVLFLFGWFVFLAGFLILLISGEDFMFMMHLACYGIFLHGTILLLGTAFIIRKKYKKTAVFSATCSAILLIIALDAFIIEPTWLDITHYHIQSDEITKPIKIAVIADFQTADISDYELEVLQKVMDVKPDLILMPGDYIQAGERQKEVVNDFREALKAVKFNAPLGVYAVRGDVEYDNWQEIFQGFPVNTTESRLSYSLEELTITSLSLRDSRNTKTKLANPNRKKFHIAFGHVPDFVLGEIHADLLVAGHTHGGQVVVPFFGPPVTYSFVPRSWASGLTELAGNQYLFVSRGVGMERDPRPPKLRFFCRPELAFIHLEPK